MVPFSVDLLTNANLIISKSNIKKNVGVFTRILIIYTEIFFVKILKW